MLHWLHFSAEKQAKECTGALEMHEPLVRGGNRRTKTRRRAGSVRSTADDTTRKFAQGHIITFIISTSIKKAAACSSFLSYHAHHQRVRARCQSLQQHKGTDRQPATSLNARGCLPIWSNKYGKETLNVKYINSNTHLLELGLVTLGTTLTWCTFCHE